MTTLINKQELKDGLTTTELIRLNKGKSLTYDDIILLPDHIDFSIDSIDLSTQITPKIRLNTPLISSPMDTVTESRMAISLALHGGIGIIHCNCTKEKQSQFVTEVKRYNNGFIDNPVTVKPTETVGDLREIMKIHTFSSFPVTENGENHSKLLGMVTKRDIEFVDDNFLCLSQVMTPRDEICVGLKGCSLANAYDLVKKKKVNQLPIVDHLDNLVAMICKRDIIGNLNYPLSSRDKQTNQLLVGAAVTTLQTDYDRIELLIKSGVDLIVIDSSNGDSKYQLDTLKFIKTNYPQTEVIAGNVVTTSQAANLIAGGADCIRVGQGSGSICTTQGVCGVGRGQASAVYAVSNYCRSLKKPVPVIADGGIKATGDIVKALVFGGSAVMMGGMLAGSDESPGEITFRDGVRLKKYRGMGSANCKDGLGSSSRYLSVSGNIFVSQGVSGEVMHKGSLSKYLPYIMKGVKHGFQNIGCKNLKELEKVRMEKRSLSSQKEGGVHDLFSYVNHGIQ